MMPEVSELVSDVAAEVGAAGDNGAGVIGGIAAVPDSATLLRGGTNT